jgi:hypothetical protein
VRTVQPSAVIKTIFFDAVGTLFYLPKSVGWHYSKVARGLHLDLDERALDKAFAAAWQKMPPRQAIDGPRENDDKDWWRELVDLILDDVAPSLREADRDNFFEVAYEHFAAAGVWELYPEVIDVLEKLQSRFHLAVISNFDGRLRMILEQLGNFSARVKVSRPASESSLARRRRPGTRLESRERGRIVDLPVRSTEKFAARSAHQNVATALWAVCARLTETRLQSCSHV